jgi:uncharacterized repeat protein (TIGR03803 family)
VRELETRVTPSLTTLASFPGLDGASPYAGLIMDGSGNLYGTTQVGGTLGYGTVFELAAGSRAITVMASFDGADGAYPSGGLIMDSSGNLYGTTSGAGAFNAGTVFELAQGSGTVSTLASFKVWDGAYPTCTLIMDARGNLYGTTPAGGAHRKGTVFEVGHGRSTITTLASFDGTDGWYPGGGVIMDSRGNLYGTTAVGGADNRGSVFEVAKGSGTITTLASFSGPDGANPYCALVMDSNGNLYGTTTVGGVGGHGTVFELPKGSSSVSRLASFDGANGASPQGGLVLDTSGNLYGAATRGGASNDGTVFELVQGHHKITSLASFGGTDGIDPAGGLIMDSSGNLYGTAAHGAAGYGDIFELAQGHHTITTLASFTAPDGAGPVGGLISDGHGNLYGTTSQGGAYGDGTIFEIAQGSSVITVLASFDGMDGAHPLAGLVMDNNGNLYGTTSAGGTLAAGTVFELLHGRHRITTLGSFDGTDGAEPECALIFDGSGNLYGTAANGGAFGDGTMFELAAGSGTITTLASFDGSNGAQPYANLIMDSSGNLYGTTVNGGASSKGTVFELLAGSGSITTLASFDGTNGANPQAALIMDDSGNLYGTTQLGGASGDGTVFELAAGSGTITMLASFNGTDGQDPAAALVVDSSGNLYGTTYRGGASGDGTAFELPAGASAISTLASFGGADGANPQASLILGSHGNLYGTTVSGGASGEGTVFELPGAVLPADQWTGANFAVDTNWSDGANWSLGVPPVAGQTVVFTNNSSVKSFTSTVDSAFTNAIGVLHIDSSWGGTITVNGPLSVTGNFSLASGSLGGSGAVTIAGSGSRWTGGQIDVGAGGFTNTGTLIADTTGGNLVLTGAGTVTNDGRIVETGTGSVLLENGATLSDARGSTYDIAGNGGIAESGGGTFDNAGTLEKSKGGGTSTIATTSLSNTGTVAVASGTLDISAAVSQVSGSTLTGGAWTVAGTTTGHSKLDITSAGRLTTLGSGGAVTLSGPNTIFSNLSGLTTIDHGASFSLLGGQSFTTTRALTNKGSLTIGPGSVLTVTGSYRQPLGGTLTIQVGGTDSAPIFGELVSTTGTVALAGKLSVTSTVEPAKGSSFEILDNQGNAAISGAFRGLPEGATFKVKVGTTHMTFQITYAGTDADGNQNVIITRIS